MIHSFLVDFIRGGPRLDYRQTFGRALAAYVTDRDNAPLLVASGKPRFGYSTTGICKGVLVESAATNYALYSQLLNNASGGYTATGLASNTVGNAGAPDGTSTVSIMQENTSASAHSLLRSGDTVATLAQNLCTSIYVMYVDCPRIRFNLYDNAATSNGVYSIADIQQGIVTTAATGAANGIAVGAGTMAVNNQWYRYWLSGQPNTSGTVPRTIIHMISGTTTTTYTGTSRQVKLWGLQIEPGTYPSSYIPTTSAAVARPADVLTQTLGSWWNASKGTLLVDFTAPGYLSGTQQVASIDDATANNKLELVISSGTLYARSTTGGSEDVSLNLGALTASTDYRVAFAFTGSDFSAVLNGGTAVTDASGTVPTVTTLRYGCDYAGANQLNGYIGRLIYWPQRVSNTAMQALTK